MKANDKFKLHGTEYTAVKLFSSEVINVSGVDYQRWYFTDEKGREFMDWVAIGKSEPIVGYRRPCVNETERRVVCS